MLYKLINGPINKNNSNISVLEKQLADKTILINELLIKIKALTKENIELKDKLQEKT